jgi:hypothetical protein
MLLQEHKFIHDHKISEALAEQSLRTIYNEITGHYSHPGVSHHPGTSHQPGV